MTKRPGFYWDSHHRFLVGLAAGVAAYFGWLPESHPATRVLLAWNVFAVVTLGLVWAIIAGRDPYAARRRARLNDSSRTALFALVIVAAIVSLFAVGWMLESTKGGGRARFGHIALGLSTVAVSWALLHTLFSLRYAHQFYRDAAQVAREHVQGGLLFPGDQPPDYLDFAYFSFVVGMTFQVSDVQIADRRIRRMALLHGLISFVFNSAILAMLVNAVAGML